jgi:hypothetical protein
VKFEFVLGPVFLAAFRVNSEPHTGRPGHVPRSVCVCNSDGGQM